jgi:threonine synthase
MSFLSHLECTSCGEEYDPQKLWNLCPECSKPLFARYALNKVKSHLNKRKLIQRSTTLWRYSELLPVCDKKFVLSMAEGFTPLINAKRLGEIVDFEDLYIKDEGANPTGSFKARGLSVAVSRARELGAKALSIPSAGNAAGAMSAYASLAGVPAFVYMPEDVPNSFVSECKAFGAKVFLVKGLITDCGKMAIKESRKYGRFDLSTLKEPYRVEGKKTMGYEIAEQFNWQLPDVIIYPTGGGTGLIGMWKAFDEMQQLDWIGAKRPRMVAVQAEGCAPIVKAFMEGKVYAEYWSGAKTIADGLRVPSAVADFLILETIRESNGIAIKVSDSEMMEGANLIAKTQGLFVSPETGATVIALQKLRHQGWLDESERVVLFNTGSGYKYNHLWKE